MKKNFNKAYDAGFDAGINGADMVNSHYKWFLDEELMLEWSRGNKDGIQKKINSHKNDERSVATDA